MSAGVNGWGWRWAYAVAWCALAWERARDDARKPPSWAPGGQALLVPAAMGFGVAAYIGLAEEPPPAIGFLWLGLALWLWVALRRVASHSGLALIAALSAWAGAGFVWMDVRTATVAAPVMVESEEPRQIAGWVERIDASGSPRRRRYVIRLSAIDDLAASEIPRRVRVSAPADAAWLGDAVVAQAMLYAPPTPSVPGAYDFARAAYFQQLGGVGRVVGAMEAAQAGMVGDPIDRKVTRVRGAMAKRLLRFGGPEAGPVLATLVTGHRGEITSEVTEDLRAASLGHVLAISGLHMALVGGGAFLLFVKLFAAIEPWARRTDVRKPAAMAALAAASAYLVLSGASVSAQRAYVMTAVALVAVLLDRRALSLASVGRAGVIVLILRPEAALEPGFQMSFAATACLIAVHGAVQRQRAEEGAGRRQARGTIASIRSFIIATAVTSFVAGLATAPFAAYHFNRIAHAGLAANLVAMPVFTLVVMPSAAAAGALAPVGLDQPPAMVASTGLDAVFALSRAVTPKEGALAPVHAAPASALALIVIGLVLWCGRARGRWRIAAPIWLIATLLWSQSPRAQLWIGPEGGVAARFGHQAGADSPGADRYGAELFLRRVGAADADAPPALETAMRCDELGCVGHVGRRSVVVTRRAGGLADDCRHADVVVFLGRLPRRTRPACAGTRLISPRASKRPMTVRLHRFGADIRTVAPSARPWWNESG